VKINDKNKLIQVQLSATLDNLSYFKFRFSFVNNWHFIRAVWANQTWGSYWLGPKETWALITWFVFAIYLHTRISKGWTGQRSAFASFRFYYYLDLLFRC
jgi:ABC-type transport system involved in cytochrome c biogenesis permease subunit